MTKFRKLRFVFNSIIYVTIIAICLTIISGCNIFSAGSYPYAEIYTINSSEENVIKAVKEFKTGHPENVVPLKNLPDGRSDSTDLWYHIYFYLPKEDKIVYCWARADSENETSFSIVSINDGLILGHWKDINKDFGILENKKILSKLEEAFLIPIRQVAERKKGL